MAKFPKMDGGSFPHIDNVNVNKWINEFDYSRYDYTQMKLQICAVPWDMGEAHIGNRTISGIGNVVWFETKAKRDAWFDAIPDGECLRFESKYRELHRDLFIDVPVPFDMCAKYNYLVVEYSLFANDSSPIAYEGANGVRKWFWFIREVEYLAPNTTRLHILDDAFQTWMYDVSVSGMVLERGHAPMFATSVETYLSNPVENSANLLTHDVDFGEATIARGNGEFVFNSGNMYALIVTTSAPGGTWGTKEGGNWKTPGNWNVQLQGIPSYFAFALPAVSLSNFLSGINANYPQFVQTLKAIAFVNGDMLTFGASFEFAGVTCNYVNAQYTRNELIKLNKSLFAYPDRYANVAKLYTSPYAHIEVSDEEGNVTVIKVEDTDGTINIESTVSLVFPWLTVNAHLTGIGKGNRRNVSFANVSNRNMPIQGNWYQTLQSWNIPTFGVYQDAGKNNDYSTHYDRAQQAVAYENEYANALASAETAQNNTFASATAAQANAIANADTIIDNADLQVAYNYAMYSADNTYHLNVTAADAYMNNAQASAANTYIGTSTNNEIEAANRQAAIGAASAGVTGATSVVANALSGNIPGAITAAIGGGTQVASTVASNNVAVDLTASQAAVAQSSNNTNAAQSNANMTSKNTAYATQAGAAIKATDTLTEGTSANNAATMTGNAGREYATMTANAGREYATDTANAARRRATAASAVTNQVNQASMNAPAEFGAWTHGDLATSRPMGLFANVVTESDSAISAAGDEFLRYGYEYERQWAFDGNWNIGKYFTYWKLSDFWVTDLNVPDMYMDKLRFFLFGGVTVWRNPADIGKRTIYENFNG